MTLTGCTRKATFHHWGRIDMTTQPEPLRLANTLENGNPSLTMEEAAAELRRLYALNQELLEALKYHQQQTRPIQRTIDAIAKAEGRA